MGDILLYAIGRLVSAGLVFWIFIVVILAVARGFLRLPMQTVAFDSLRIALPLAVLATCYQVYLYLLR